MRVVLVVALALSTPLLVEAGTREAPEIEDPVGDAWPEWVDITRVWLEHGPDDVTLIHLELAGLVPQGPDLGTGGLSNGAAFRVDFDVTTLEGRPIGDRENQYARWVWEEANAFSEVCVWQAPQSARCHSAGSATVSGQIITWDVDIKGPVEDPRIVGSGYRFENITVHAETFAAAQTLGSDVAPDEGTGISVADPRTMSSAPTTPPGEVWFPAPPTTLAVATFALLAGAALSLALLGTTLRGRVDRWAFIGALFSRIARDDVLANERRTMIFALIEAEPGITFAELRRRSGLGSGVLVHHLGVLARQGFVRREADGRRTRFFLGGRLGPGRGYLGAMREKVVRIVAEHPGIAINLLAARAGTSRQNLSYHLRILEATGQVICRQDGARRRCFLA